MFKKKVKCIPTKCEPTFGPPCIIVHLFDVTVRRSVPHPVKPTLTGTEKRHVTVNHLYFLVACVARRVFLTCVNPAVRPNY